MATTVRTIGFRFGTRCVTSESIARQMYFKKSRPKLVSDITTSERLEIGNGIHFREGD